MNKQKFLIIACILLGIALFPLPYGYYQFLRFGICGLALWLLISDYNKTENLSIGLIITAIAYNPIFKIHFDKEIWSLINIITILYFVYLIMKIKKDWR